MCSVIGRACGRTGKKCSLSGHGIELVKPSVVGRSVDKAVGISVHSTEWSCQCLCICHHSDHTCCRVYGMKLTFVCVACTAYKIEQSIGLVVRKIGRHSSGISAQ